MTTTKPAPATVGDPTLYAVLVEQHHTILTEHPEMKDSCSAQVLTRLAWVTNTHGHIPEVNEAVRAGAELIAQAVDTSSRDHALELRMRAVGWAEHAEMQARR